MPTYKFINNRVVVNGEKQPFMFRSDSLIEEIKRLKNKEDFNNIRLEKENFDEADGRCLIIVPYEDLLQVDFESKKFNVTVTFIIYRELFDRILDSNVNEFYIQFY